jgi:hypothetical protein
MTATEMTIARSARAMMPSDVPLPRIERRSFHRRMEAIEARMNKAARAVAATRERAKRSCNLDSWDRLRRAVDKHANAASKKMLEKTRRWSVLIMCELESVQDRDCKTPRRLTASS